MTLATMRERLQRWWHAECRLTRPLMEVGEDGELEHNTNGMMVLEVLGVFAIVVVIGLLNNLLN